MQLYTSRRKKLGNAFSSTKCELLLAWTEQWLPKHSGNFSQAILLKGYFFYFYFCCTASPRSCATSHHSPEDSRTEGQEMSQQEPNPERQHHHPQHP